MAIAVDDVFRISSRQSLAGQVIVNTWYLRVMALPGAVDQPTMLEVANQIKEVLRLSQALALTYTTWSAQKVRGANVLRDSATCKISGGEVFEGSFTGTLTGAQNADPLPPQDAIVATLKTGLAGRSRRGRHYVGGWTEEMQNAGTAGATFLNQLQTNYSNYGAANKPSALEPIFEWGVWSETIASGCKPSALHPHERTFVPALGQHPELAYAAITEIVVRPILRSQRRRQLGVGQ